MNAFLRKIQEDGFDDYKIRGFLDTLIRNNPTVFFDMMKDGSECEMVFNYFVLELGHNPLDLFLSIIPEEMQRNEAMVRALFEGTERMQIFLSERILEILSFFVNQGRHNRMCLKRTPSKLQEKHAGYLRDFFIPILLDEALKQRMPIALDFSREDEIIYRLLFDFLSLQQDPNESWEKMTTILATSEKEYEQDMLAENDEIKWKIIIDKKVVYFKGKQSESGFFSASPKPEPGLAAHSEKAEMSEGISDNRADEEAILSKNGAGKPSRGYTLGLMSSLPDEVKAWKKEEEIYIPRDIPLYAQLKHAIYIDPDTREYIIMYLDRSIQRGTLPNDICLDDFASRLNHEDLKKSILEHIAKKGHLPPTKTRTSFRYFCSSSADVSPKKPSNAPFIAWGEGPSGWTVGHTQPGGPSLR